MVPVLTWMWFLDHIVSGFTVVCSDFCRRSTSWPTAFRMPFPATSTISTIYPLSLLCVATWDARDSLTHAIAKISFEFRSSLDIAVHSGRKASSHAGRHLAADAVRYR